MANKMRPIYPGEILREELSGLGLSANAFAQALSVPANRINSILNGQRVVTADTALRLARYFGTTAEFWLNLQTAYDVKIARQISGRTIEKDVKPAVKTAA
jgi:addiction module HigA family antidote